MIPNGNPQDVFFFYSTLTLAATDSYIPLLIPNMETPKTDLVFILRPKQKCAMYNAFNVYRRELAPGTVSLTGDRAQGDDGKHWAYSTLSFSYLSIKTKIKIKIIVKNFYD